MKTSWVQSV